MRRVKLQIRYQIKYQKNNLALKNNLANLCEVLFTCIMMASGRANVSSVSLGQKLADSLLHFVNEDSLSFDETESIQANNVSNILSDNIIEGELNAMQRDGPRAFEYLHLNGDRLLWKSSLEMLKDFMLQVQEQAKLVSPGGKARRFKSADKRLEMTCHSSKQLILKIQKPRFAKSLRLE